ncbi:hypothetical protein TSUD_146960 [Trifolium subterraneum]|uniref:Integrase catalytic domain-containing protein n=1 Tax=Trifolium subterraneum TaxID=3900 RepID=A0A2Z6N6Y0_TRISU|nr:hypothetical protein TSUD_146960 [Trifolium subterraneum]
MAANHGNSPSIQVAMEEIRSLQKKVTTMEKERVEQNVDSDDESLIESQPFRQSLWDSKVPDNFKSPHLPTFDGKTDPVEHLMAVGTQTAIIGAPEHLRCKLLSGTFKDAALRWYMNLPNNSIESYADFHKKFIHQFSGTKHVKVTATSLFTIRQNYAETHREYLARFSEATITVSNPNQEMFVAAFHNGLKAGHLNESLASPPPRCKRRYPADREYTPLNRARVHVLHEILQAGLAPLPPPRMHNTIMGPDTEAWCAYHRCKGHETERCFRLRDLIEDLIISDHLRKFLEDAAKGQIALPKQAPNQQKGDGRNKGEKQRVAVNTISGGFAGGGESVSARKPLNPYSGTLVGFAGEQVDVMGHITLYTTFGEDENAKTIKVRYLVVKTLFTSYNIIIGRPTFNALGAVMSTLYLSIKYPLNNGKVRVVKGDQVLARKCYESSLKIRHRPSKPVSPPVSEERTNGINMVNITDLDRREEFQDRRVSPIEDLEQVQIGEHSHQTTNIGTSLQLEEREKIVTLLRNNRDLFAWQPSNMPGIDESIITHKLSISPVNKPVVQRKRKVGEERRAAITEEVAKLKEAGFIEEIKYPTWLANVVMVKKASGKWRLCVDFTDLNKACPKDPYPLPNIDRLIDGASSYKTLSFMDAYSGYNQIKMHPMDAQHTTFMSNTCNYFYNKEGEHDKDLEGILKSVRKYNMRLNPANQVSGEFQTKDPQLVKNSNGGRGKRLAKPNNSIFTNGRPPPTRDEAAKVKKMAVWYTLVGDKLYKRAFSAPMFLCVSNTEACRILKEEHEGSCGSHIGSRSLAGKVMRAGFYWPNLHDDAVRHVSTCDRCQRYSNLHHAPGEPLKSVLSPWPFYMWGVDILGPFPISTAQARFGLPKYIVSDNGTQFASEKVVEYCRGKEIQNTFISVEHPQANGQAESANKVILRALKRRVTSKQESWVEHLSAILWSYHTTPQLSTGEPPFTMVYGADAMIPVEIQPSCPGTGIRYRYAVRHFKKN